MRRVRGWGGWRTGVDVGFGFGFGFGGGGVEAPQAWP